MAQAQQLVRGRADPRAPHPGRRRFGLIRAIATACAIALASCAPTTQHALVPPASFQGPRFEGDKFITFDGAELGLTTWAATAPAPPPQIVAAATNPIVKSDAPPPALAAPPAPVEPWAVIIGVHGMNDYAETFYLAGPYWAQHGVTTYAYDARGFGRSPNRGVWAGNSLMIRDLQTAVAVARQRHPHAIIAVVGESMGAAEAVVAFGSSDGPQPDRVVLAAPAVWGWDALPRPYAVTLWLAGHGLPYKKVTPPRGVAPVPSDNNEMLRKVSRDRLMIWGTRIDSVYGLVTLMNDAAKHMSEIKPPVAYFYGQKDKIVPKKATLVAASRLPPGARTAYYPDGYHMILRDLHAQLVWDDTLAFLKDPNAPLPSGVGPVLAARK